MEHTAKFFVGQIVHHKKFDYRGVVFDVDATFQGTDEWYELVARSRPPKHMPWYHVLVDGAERSGRPGSLPTPAPHRSGRAGSSASGSSTDGFATRARPSGWPSFAGEGIARGGGGTASTASISSATDG